MTRNFTCSRLIDGTPSWKRSGYSEADYLEMTKYDPSDEYEGNLYERRAQFRLRMEAEAKRG
jgi:hypothetical protein